MNAGLCVLPVGLLIPEDEANPQHVRRMISVAEQRAAGRTGGGPACPWPGCEKRMLAELPQDDRYQCMACHRGVRVEVTVDGLAVSPIYLTRPRATRRQTPVVALCPSPSPNCPTCGGPWERHRGGVLCPVPAEA
jgi:hypothetical protein